MALLLRRGLAALLLAAALMLAAALAAGTTMAQPLEKVEIVLDWKALPTFAGYYLARDMGAFERRGLDVSFKEVQGATLSAKMIGEGKPYWIGSSSGMATAIARSTGQPVKSLAVYYHKTPTTIFTRAEDRIAHPRDLYGKTLGTVKGSITNEELKALFLLNKLDLSKVNVVQVDWDPFALLEKKVDALIDYEEQTPAELLSEGRRLLLLRLADFGVRTYSLNLIVNENAWADPKKRATAKKIAEAVLEGYSLVSERPGDAAVQFSNLFPRLSPNFVVRSMVAVQLQLGQPPLGAQTKEGWNDTINLLSSLHLLGRPVAADELAIFE